jgi:hypothetical protein
MNKTTEEKLDKLNEALKEAEDSLQHVKPVFKVNSNLNYSEFLRTEPPKKEGLND